MRIKTFINNNHELLDQAVNAFEQEHLVKATQTTMIFDHSTGFVLHKAVVFYEPRK